MMTGGQLEGNVDMAHVQDVAAYILRREGAMTSMKLQKLCYYAYGFHLAWEERSLFPEPFQAWANGPVCPALYELHRGQFNLQPGDIAGDIEALDPGERESVDLVLDGYGELTAHELSSMTHDERPWIAARARSSAAPLERSQEQLTDEEIFEFFDSLASFEVVDDDEVIDEMGADARQG
jgi:uncharacterized phage-associated protein